MGEEIPIFFALAIVVWIFKDVIIFVIGYNISAGKGKISASASELLNKNFTYYQKLNSKQKQSFDKRIRYFLSSKRFIPKEMTHVTDEMKIMISSSAVQLTFGLSPLKLMFFNKIFVYPDKYESKSGNFHKGEVDTKHHSISLSWKDFVEGYLKPNDGYNVGLHEFAHALKIEDSIRNDEYDFFDTKLIGELHKEFKNLQSTIKADNHPVLRNYAGTNFKW